MIVYGENTPRSRMPSTTDEASSMVTKFLRVTATAVRRESSSRIANGRMVYSAVVTAGPARAVSMVESPETAGSPAPPKSVCCSK